jgi:hypothetical protein
MSLGQTLQLALIRTAYTVLGPGALILSQKSPDPTAVDLGTASQFKDDLRC